MKRNKEELIRIFIDGNETTISKGQSLATVLMQQKQLAFSELEEGTKRAPICNMGVCYECSVFVKGQGRVRSCMTKATDEMEVFTTNADFESDNEPIDDLKPTRIEQVIYDVAIIGAGPSGLGALDELSAGENRVIVIDEQELPGGQIYRQPPSEFKSTGKNADFVFKHHNHPHVDWYMKTTVLGIEQNLDFTRDHQEEIFEIQVDHHPDIRARQVIFGLGAYDRLLTIPGWHLPGVMGAGALQVFAKSQHFVPGEEIVLTGTHPFLFIVAEEIIKLGGNVKAIFLSQNFPNVKEMLGYSVHGMKQIGKAQELIRAYRTIQKAGVDLHLGFVPSSIEGDEANKTVTFSKLSSTDSTVDLNENLYVNCDVLGMCFGFDASSELARQAGCDMEYRFQNGGWIAKHSSSMESSIPSLYVAGEITGIGGAELAEIEGRIAALAILRKQGKQVDRGLRKYQRMKRKAESFSTVLNEKTTLDQDIIYQLLKPENTYLCKCERVTTGELNQTAEDMPSLSSINSLKLYTRCGMGLCQGRYCENALMTWVEKQTGQEFPDEKFNTRQPIKPILIKDFISK